MSTKVRMTYTPEGGSKREWTIDFENPPWDLMFATEKATGWPWQEFTDRLAKGSAIALQAFVWTLRKRDEPRLTLEAVEVPLDAFELEALEDEEPEVDPDPEA